MTHHAQAVDAEGVIAGAASGEATDDDVRLETMAPTRASLRPCSGQARADAEGDALISPDACVLPLCAVMVVVGAKPCRTA